MNDASTGRPFELTSDDHNRPVMRVPNAQLQGVRSLFDRHGFDHEVIDHGQAVMLDGVKPYILIRFDGRTDPGRIRRLLDDEHSSSQPDERTRSSPA